MRFTKLEKIINALRESKYRFIVLNDKHIKFGEALQIHIEIRSKDFLCYVKDYPEIKTKYATVDALIEFIYS